VMKGGGQHKKGERGCMKGEVDRAGVEETWMGKRS